MVCIDQAKGMVKHWLDEQGKAKLRFHKFSELPVNKLYFDSTCSLVANVVLGSRLELGRFQSLLHGCDCLFMVVLLND